MSEIVVENVEFNFKYCIERDNQMVFIRLYIRGGEHPRLIKN